jgi:hypothetical protein
LRKKRINNAGGSDVLHQEKNIKMKIYIEAEKQILRNNNAQHSPIAI